jgi:phosphoribosylformylglycinamidine synthase subunit PurQ / glutaminase
MVAVVRFPGTLDHDSAARAVQAAGGTATGAWHQDTELPAGTTAVVIPGGFSYGDHLRPGAIVSCSVFAMAFRCSVRQGSCLGYCAPTQPPHLCAAK